MKKVLIISYAFPPQNVVGATRPYKFCKYLPQFGWIPYVLTRTIRKNAPIDENALLDHANPTKIYRCHDLEPMGLDEQSFPIRLAWKLFNEGLAFPDNQILWNFPTLFKAVSLIQEHNIDVIFCTAPPHSSFITAILASKITGKPFIADLRDLWTLHEYFYLKHQGRPLATFYENWLEKKTVYSAALVILNTSSAREMMAEKYPEQSNKFISLSNGFDPDDFSGINAKSFDKFTILHGGSFYLDRNPEAFLGGLSLLIKENSFLKDKIQVIFAGRNSRTYLEKSSQLGIDDLIIYYDQLPKEQLFQFSLGAHLLLLFLGFNEQSRYVIPAKLYEYIATQRPVLAFVPQLSQVKSIIENLGLGSALSTEDPSIISRTIKHYWNDFENGNSSCTFHQQTIEQYDYKNLAQRLGIILDSITSKT